MDTQLESNETRLNETETGCCATQGGTPVRKKGMGKVYFHAIHYRLIADSLDVYIITSICELGYMSMTEHHAHYTLKFTSFHQTQVLQQNLNYIKSDFERRKRVNIFFVIFRLPPFNHSNLLTCTNEIFYEKTTTTTYFHRKTGFRILVFLGLRLLVARNLTTRTTV